MESIYWATDVFIVGLLGHIAFISGLIMLPVTTSQKKQNKNVKKDDDADPLDNS